MENTDRRNFLCTAAVAAAAISLPVMAVAGEADPIFAAIEQRQLALENAIIAGKAVTEVEKPWFAQENRWKNPPARLAAVHDQHEQAWMAHAAAVDNLLTTRPTTVAGVVAALRCVSQGRFGDHPRDGILLNVRENHERAGQFLQMLADALAKSA